MEKPKSLSERLKAIRLESNLSKTKTKNEIEVNAEEYPKLRKPKPATLLKIQARQKKSDNKEEVSLEIQSKLNESFNLYFPKG